MEEKGTWNMRGEGTQHGRCGTEGRRDMGKERVGEGT